MSRLVAVSNRVSVPRKGAAPGGLAVGVLAAMQARGGLWFGWSGDMADREPREPRLSIRGGISFATIDLLAKITSCITSASATARSGRCFTISSTHSSTTTSSTTRISASTGCSQTGCFPCCARTTSSGCTTIT